MNSYTINLSSLTTLWETLVMSLTLLGAGSVTFTGSSAPANTVAPALSGTEQQGQTLTTTNGTWSNSPSSYSYQWQRADDSGFTTGVTNIGSDQNTYLLTGSEVGKYVRCQVTATNAGGSTTADSDVTGAILIAAPENTVAPAASGTAQQGEQETSTSGTWTGSPSYAYQWEVSDDGISGWSNATGTGNATDTYTWAAGDVGKYGRCKVTGTNAGGSTSAYSNVVGPVVIAAPANTVAPAVTGTATQGQTLSCTTGTWSNTPTSYAYQWQRDSGGGYGNIASATSNTYTLQAGDVGATVRCVVTATNAGGSTSANSNATGTIGSGVTSATSSGTTGNPSINLPANTNGVGYLYVQVCYDTAGGSFTAPAGWTRQVAVLNTGNFCRGDLFTRAANGGSSMTLTGVGQSFWSAVAGYFPNAAGLDGSPSGQGIGTGLTTPAVTSSGANRTLVSGWTAKLSSSGAITKSAGATLLGSTTSFYAATVGYETVGSGSTGSKTATASGVQGATTTSLLFT